MKLGFEGSKPLFLMFFCHFDEKKSKKLIPSYSRHSFVFIIALFLNLWQKKMEKKNHSKLLNTFFCFYHCTVFLMLSKRAHSKLLMKFFCFCHCTVFSMLSKRAQQWALLICSKRPSTKSRFFSGWNVRSYLIQKQRV